MYTSTVLIVVLFSTLSQQLLGEEDHTKLLRRQNEAIKARQLGGDLSFCYGENSICDQSNSLFSKCNAFSNQADDSQWYQCLCGNGYMAADEACHWCDIAYGIPDFFSLEDNESECSQYNGGTIAPIPASVLSIESSFNATYTGVISSGGSGATATGSTVASTTKSGSQATSSTPRNTQSNSTSSVSHTVTIVQTLNGGSPGTLTAAPTTTQGSVETSSTTTKATSSSGAAQGLHTGVALVLSVVTFGVSALCLL